ncbi:MAG TPA: hypothetical protein VH113_07140 [Gemmatimonadales bacterium]|nr:hypothetical protein [Gemmatimonadales bacterium]
MRRLRYLVLALMLGCNDGLQPTVICDPHLVGVCGHVTFRGSVPDSTAAVYIVAYRRFPQSPADLFNFVPLPPQQLAVPGTGDSVEAYSLPLLNDQYHWVLAVWVKVGLVAGDTANEDAHLMEAGYYRDPADTTKPGIVTVHSAGTGDIDFVVDFANMHSVSYFFPP